MKKILHIITSLDAGGAQAVMYNLIKGIDPTKFENHVISLTGDGFYGEKLRRIGVNVYSINIQLSKRNIFSLFFQSRKLRPDILNGWMYHANLTCSFIGLFILRVPIVWGIHNSGIRSEDMKRFTRFIAKLCGVLSRVTPTRIIYCSEQAKNIHEQYGYNKSKSVAILNGIDTSIFKANKNAKRGLHCELGINQNSPLIGCVARYHPLKNHDLFFSAAKLLHALRPDVHFLLCGIDMDINNSKLIDTLSAYGLEEYTHLLGLRNDIEVITAALDVATSCSLDESFSLTAAEAMACEVMVVVTNNPGATSVLGESGWIVPLHDPVGLSNTWNTILSTPQERKNRIGKNSRERVKANYSIEYMHPG